MSQSDALFLTQIAAPLLAAMHLPWVAGGCPPRKRAPPTAASRKDCARGEITRE